MPTTQVRKRCPSRVIHLLTLVIAELLQVMVPQVQELIGTSHSTEGEITEALRKANYDVEQTVQTLLEKPLETPAVQSTRT